MDTDLHGCCAAAQADGGVSGVGRTVVVVVVFRQEARALGVVSFSGTVAF